MDANQEITGKQVQKLISSTGLIDLVATKLGANTCLLYTLPSPRDRTRYRMPSSA